MKYDNIDILSQCQPQKMCYDGILGIKWPEMPVVVELPSLFRSFYS